jgi:transposase
MPLRIIHISEADANAAKYDMFNHPDPLVQKRALCLHMKYLNFEQQAIAKVLDCNRGTVTNYLDLYESTGYPGLIGTIYNKPVSDLDAHCSTIESSFRKQPPRSVKEAACRIKTLTGIARSQSRVRAFLHRIGMRPLQTGQIPAKANVEEQQKFHDQTLQPLLEQCKAGKCHVLFLDSAHFVLAAFVAIVWCFERVFVKTAPGRFRLNVIGAIHATSQELTALYNTTYITASTVVELLEEIALQYADRPIHIILDNARYQHCQFVIDAALRLNISLVFLPPYSPNLNLIERLWKFVKAEVCAANYFPNAQAFQKAIVEFLNKLHTKSMKKELKSRLALNFQHFGHVENLAA